MYPIDIKKFTLPHNKRTQKPPKQLPPHHKPGEKFLKGPIPLNWLAKAARLPGKALHVAIAIWFWVGIKKSCTVGLSNVGVKVFGISRYSKKRGLKSLELAKLVIVKQHTGCAPIVTVVDIKDS